MDVAPSFGALDGEATEVLGDELATLGAQHDLRSWLPVGDRAAVVAHEEGLHLVRCGSAPGVLTAWPPGAYRDHRKVARRLPDLSVG